MEIKKFDVVSDLVDFMPMSSVVELYGAVYYKGSKYKIPKKCLNYMIKHFRVCTDSDDGRIVYRIFV